MTRRLARASNLEAIARAHPFNPPKESKEKAADRVNTSKDVHSGAAASAPPEVPKQQAAAELKKRKVRREPKGMVLANAKGVLNNDEVQMVVEKWQKWQEALSAYATKPCCTHIMWKTV